jgi:hypothetical protein
MNDLMPIAAQISDARSHVERAGYLLACPIALLRKYDFTIRNRLVIAGDGEGLMYLHRLDTILHQTRDGATGLFSDGALELLMLAGLELQRAAAAADAGSPAPDHSITDL